MRGGDAAAGGGAGGAGEAGAGRGGPALRGPGRFARQPPAQGHGCSSGSGRVGPGPGRPRPHPRRAVTLEPAPSPNPRNPPQLKAPLLASRAHVAIWDLRAPPPHLVLQVKATWRVGTSEPKGLMTKKGKLGRSYRWRIGWVGGEKARGGARKGGRRGRIWKEMERKRGNSHLFNDTVSTLEIHAGFLMLKTSL